MPDGRPPPGMGELFISIHPGGFRGVSSEYLHCIHSINITINIKIEGSTDDKVGLQNVVLPYRGIEEIAQLLVESIHDNYLILQMANSILGSNVNGFIEPLRFNNSSPPRIVGSDWFSTEKSNKSGIIQTLTFGDAVRIQYSSFQPVVSEFPTEEYTMDNKWGSVQENPPPPINNVPITGVN